MTTNTVNQPRAQTFRCRMRAFASVVGVVLIVFCVWSGAWISAALAATVAVLLIISWRHDARQSASPDNLARPDADELNEFGRLLNSELIHVEEEITRTDNMIGEATSGISGSFNQLYELSRDQNVLIQELFDQGQGEMDISRLRENAQAALETIAGNRPQLEKAIATAVQSLQFEDISSQALNEAQLSLTYLRNIATALESTENSPDRLLQINRRYLAWANKRRKPVTQKNLDEGSVELF